jgi:hypothetical protein
MSLVGFSAGMCFGLAIGQASGNIALMLANVVLWGLALGLAWGGVLK